MFGRLATRMPVMAMTLNMGVMKTTQRNFAAFHKAVLKPLPYPINGLEPVISQHLMEFHYGKHHQTYVNNLNGLLE